MDLRCLEVPELRGLGRYTVEITRALAARPSLQLIGFARGPIVRSAGIDVRILRIGSELVAEQIELPAWTRRLRLDVLFCPSNRGLPLLAPCPTVLTLHDTAEWNPAVSVPASRRSSFRINYASLASLASAASLITVSNASADQISARLSVDRGAISVIYEGAADRFGRRDGDGGRRVLAKYGLEGGYILALGVSDPKKDLGTLVRAHALLSERSPHLVLVGALNEHGERLKELSRTLGTSRTVHYLGAVDDADLPSLYQEASCLCSPAVAEGFGLPVVEAMSAGVPVIAADSGSLPEILGTGGQLFEPRNPLALASVISVLLGDPCLRRRWGHAAAMRSLDFSWDRAAALTEDVLRRAAGTPMLAVVSPAPAKHGIVAQADSPESSDPQRRVGASS